LDIQHIMQWAENASVGETEDDTYSATQLGIHANAETLRQRSNG